MRLVVTGKPGRRIIANNATQRGRSIRALLAYAKTILAHDFKTQSRQGS